MHRSSYESPLFLTLDGRDLKAGAPALPAGMPGVLRGEGVFEAFNSSLEGYGYNKDKLERLAFKDHPIFKDVKNGIDCYFVHSYYFNVIDKNNIYAYSKYGNLNYPTIICYNNIFGI